MEEFNIPNAPPELRELLQRLHENGSLKVSQHNWDPRPDEWFGGDWGPYPTAQEALVNGVRWLRGLYDDADTERNELIAENRRLRIALEALQAERLGKSPAPAGGDQVDSTTE